MDGAITELVKGQYIRVVKEKPYVCSPLSVVENSSGKKRLVVNMRHVNKFLLRRSFKYEDLHIAMMLFEQGELMFSFDLKSGYHHVDIAAQHYKYLGLEWNNKFYVFTVLGWQWPHICSPSFYVHWSGYGKIRVLSRYCT